MLAREPDDATRDEKLELASTVLADGKHQLINEVTDAFSRLSNEQLPSQKIQAIVDVCHGLVKEMECNEIPVDGDHLIPMLSDSIVVLRPKLLISNLAFARRFRCRHCIDGKARYAMTSFAVAIQGILNESGVVEGTDSAMLDALLPFPADHFPRDSIMQTGGTSLEDRVGSLLTLRPISDFSASLVNSFTAIPRQLTAVMTQTFRSSSSSTALLHNGDEMRPKRRLEGRSLDAFQERILSCNSVEDLSVADVRDMLVDYKRLLARHHFNK